MEGVLSLKQPTAISRVSPNSRRQFNLRSYFPTKTSFPMHDHRLNSSLHLQSHQSDSRTVSAIVPLTGESVEKIKSWEAVMLQEEIALRQGITIRRRPPTEGQHNNTSTPHNILEEIIWFKDIEVSKLKERVNLDLLEEDLNNAPPTKDFAGSLRAAYQRTGLPGLIAEVKKASPSRGIIRKDFNPVEIAKAYERGGAACLSVLTDEKYFQGSFENLEAIRNAGVQCPLLCKEFIVDPLQIYYARLKGADAILLIAGVLSDQEITYMLKTCKSLGLTALVEVHDEREMDRMLDIEGIELIGINNRDLQTFKVDISNTRKLLDKRRLDILNRKDIIVVGESGLFTPTDISYVQESGVRAVLVGESLVKQTDPAKGIAGLFGKDISI